MGAEGVPWVACELLGYAELRRLVKVNKRTIQRWVKNGSFPGPVEVGGGGLARWRRADVERHIAALPPRRPAQVVA